MALNLNKKIGILILGLIILIISVIYFKQSTSVKDLKGKFTALTDGVVNLQLSYTNPSTFGTNGATFGSTLVYLLLCPTSTTCPADITSPTISQLTGTTNLFNPSGTLIPDPKSEPANKASGKIIYNAPIPTLKLVPGSTYKIGVGISNNQPSIFGTTAVPNIYGEFTYITFIYKDNAGPGTISGLSNNFIFI